LIYFDTCALLKLVRADAQSGALGAFIDARPAARWFTSELARTELARAVRRVNHDDRGRLVEEQRLRAELDYAERVWERLDLIAVTDHSSALTPAEGSPRFSRIHATRQRAEQNRACSRRGVNTAPHCSQLRISATS